MQSGAAQQGPAGQARQPDAHAQIVAGYERGRAGLADAAAADAAQGGEDSAPGPESVEEQIRPDHLDGMMGAGRGAEGLFPQQMEMMDGADGPEADEAWRELVARHPNATVIDDFMIALPNVEPEPEPEPQPKAEAPAKLQPEPEPEPEPEPQERRSRPAPQPASAGESAVPAEGTADRDLTEAETEAAEHLAEHALRQAVMEIVADANGCAGPLLESQAAMLPAQADTTVPKSLAKTTQAAWRRIARSYGVFNSEKAEQEDGGEITARQERWIAAERKAKARVESQAARATTRLPASAAGGTDTLDEQLNAEPERGSVPYWQANVDHLLREPAGAGAWVPVSCPPPSPPRARSPHSLPLFSP